MGLANDLEKMTAYLFRCDDEGLFAVSCDRSGANIPRNLCPEGWQMMKAFELGVHEPAPASINPEPIIRGLRSSGYYIWRKGIGHPEGTSQ